MLNEYSYSNSDLPEELNAQNSGETDSLKQYLREIGRYDLLTEDEVKTLFKRIEAGDKAAHDVVVEHNLRLVVKYAKSIKKAYRAEESIMDLVQAGNIGLMRAVDKFEVDKGYAFSTYASWWIKQSIIRHIFDNESSIRVPVHMSERFVSLSRAIRNFQEENGREPTFEEISKRVNITKKEYDVFKSLDRNVISLNTVINEESDTEILDFIPCTEAADPVYEETHQKMLCETINEVLARLETRESYIIKARYGLDGMPAKTLEEIGRDLGITRERVRQIETIAMKKLRTSVKAEALRAYR
ncbi:MAG: RNA polymerase sigma factor RpoD/SigA [Clostridia bacterium]|nr:RNA polymerase sigma factor RpoD/SigA [Clostridia bacterium]